MTAKKKKDGGQRNPIMPRPSYMWIYVLVAAFIIGYSLYGAENTEPVRSDWNTVEGMVRSGDVERIEVVNRDVAEVFLKKDAVEKYRTDSTQPQFKRLPDEGVQLVFNIGSVDAFREDLKAAEQQSGQSVPVRYENKENGWMNLLVNFLPWVLIIGVWFFIMRGMSRGGGAAGGGLMNVGKVLVSARKAFSGSGGSFYATGCFRFSQSRIACSGRKASCPSKAERSLFSKAPLR